MSMVQDYSISIANTLEILQACTKPWICDFVISIWRPLGARLSADTVMIKIENMRIQNLHLTHWSLEDLGVILKNAIFMFFRYSYDSAIR